MITMKLINGVFKRIQTIVYPSQGTVVNRILPINSDVPEEVIVVREPVIEVKQAHFPSEEIHNMEFAMYSHYAQSMGM